MMWRRRCFWPIASSCFSDRPARIKADIAVDRPYPRHRGDPELAELRRQHSGPARIGRDMVSAQRQFDTQGARAGCNARSRSIAPGCWRREFAARAAQHDRDASFPFENFKELSEAGLLALTVPAALGGHGAGALDAARDPRHLRQGRSIDRAGAVDALHPASGDGEKHALAGPARAQAGAGNRRRRGADQRAAGRAGSRLARRAAACRRRLRARPRPDGGSAAARSIRPARRS